MKFNRKDILTISNFISLLRLILCAPLWFIMDNITIPEWRPVIFVFLIFMALTDMLDGYLARRLNQVSETGKIMDPLADKLAVGIIILKLFMLGEIPAYYIAVILGRDLIIFIGGIFVTRKLGRVLPSNMLGKITVIVISVVILSIVAGIDKSGLPYKSLYLLSLLLVVASLVAYTMRAVEFIKQKDKYGTV